MFLTNSAPIATMPPTDPSTPQLIIPAKTAFKHFWCSEHQVIILFKMHALLTDNMTFAHPRTTLSTMALMLACGP